MNYQREHGAHRVKSYYISVCSVANYFITLAWGATMTLRFILIALFLITLTSCGTVKNKEKINRLEATLIQYDKALRWAEIRAVASYHVDREGKPLIVDIERTKQFSVTGITILEKTIGPEATEAVILAEISYYNKNYGTVQTIRQEQLWWRSEENKAWYIESEFPEFK